ncbi:MAG TPA: M90 family metallopeptidase [Ideonella sp.]|uniref:M90 family metallopeptidase n=1 Tax=Ideonella sp. TaxID=1929293 RepID=UPI002E357D1E|nr:M90 family metallopeptidase [Ideonella sp.]HEX5686319.1 M90 family metallopeptidase [Ideonella sp.]
MVLPRLLRSVSRWRETRAVERHAIPDELWATILAAYPFIAARSAEDQQALRTLSSLFLSRKEFHGAHGMQVTDEMAVAIAAQACLPILKLGIEAYDGFVGIVVHADEVVAAREVMDEDGVVHQYDEVLTGEAMEGGPVMLAWADVLTAGESAELAYNVVIHEFAHVLDMADGAADGVPLLPTEAAREAWIACIDAEHERFADRIDAGEEDTVLDPYGAEAVEEFFAVAVEAFFVAPDAMRAEHPALYELFAGYFRQTPAN